MRISDWSSDVCSSDLRLPWTLGSVAEGDDMSRWRRRCARHGPCVNAEPSSRRVPDVRIRRAAGDEMDDERHHAALAVARLQRAEHARLRREEGAAGREGRQEAEAPDAALPLYKNVQ